MYKIEKNISYPKKRDRKYPFSEMEIGDSFFVPHKDMKNKNVLSTAAFYHSRSENKQFRTQTVSDGVRCWRIK